MFGKVACAHFCRIRLNQNFRMLNLKTRHFTGNEGQTYGNAPETGNLRMYNNRLQTEIRLVRKMHSSQPRRQPRRVHEKQCVFYVKSGLKRL